MILYLLRRHQSSPNVAHTEVADTPQKAATKPLSKSTDFSDLKLSVVSPEASVRPTYATPVPLTHLTKAERKRIQWERERGKCVLFSRLKLTLFR